MITDNSALVTAAEEQRGHLPTRGHPCDPDIEETHHVPMCSTGEDHTYGLDSDENGQYIELGCTAEVSHVVESEQNHMILDFDHVTTMREYATAAAKRAAVVQEDDLTKADAQANPVKLSK
eukprot:653923-Pyramimonas_sp.AAC.1